VKKLRSRADVNDSAHMSKSDFNQIIVRRVSTDSDQVKSFNNSSPSDCQQDRVSSASLGDVDEGIDVSEWRSA